MSSITLPINHSVMRDTAGNMLTDTSGNLLIPVPPIIVTAVVEDNHMNCSCSCLTLETDGKKETFGFCKSSNKFRQNAHNFLAKTSEIHTWRAVANMRNIVLKSKDKSRIAIKGYIGVNDFGSHYREVSQLDVTIQWGDASISVEPFYTCSMCRDPFYFGDIILNWNTMTLDFDTSGVVSKDQDDICDPTEVEIIDIEAPYNWCYREPVTMLLTDTVYTENMDPVFNDLVWEDDEQSITVEPDESVEDARIREAKGVISGTVEPSMGTDIESRDFIVTPDGLIYWRDKSKYEILSYTPLMVKRATVYGAGMYASDENGLMVYCEGWPGAGWNNTGRVFGKALDSYDEWSITKEEILEYSIENCLIAENVPFETDIHTFASKTGLFVIDWEGDDRFVQVVERTDPDTGEITYFDSPYYDGLYITGESVTLDVPDSPAAGGYSVTFYETQTQDGKYKIWLGDSAAGRYFPGIHEKPRVVKKTVEGVDDYYYYDIEPGERYVFPDGSIGGFWFSCRNRPFDTGQSASFIIDGKGYTMGVTNGYSWVFDVTPVYAWSLSPCFQDRMDVPQTIYTNDIEKPVVGEAYGSWNAETKQFTPTGTIVATGFGVYSIPVALFGNEDEGLLTYYNGATAKDREIIIEDFE